MTEIVAIDKNIHQNLKIKANPTLFQSKHKHFAPIVVQEFAVVSQEYPILFIKDSDTGRFNAVALLGLKPKENLFYHQNGWQGVYKPKILTLYPFLLHQNTENDNSIICLDKASLLVNESEGKALFDDNNEQTAWLNEQAEQLVQHVENSYTTQHFIKTLVENDLLVKQCLNIKINEQDEYTLNGFYTVDEQKLNVLSDEHFLNLRKTGALGAIYASLFSMRKIQALIKLKSC